MFSMFSLTVADFFGHQLFAFRYQNLLQLTCYCAVETHGQNKRFPDLALQIWKPPMNNQLGFCYTV